MEMEAIQNGLQGIMDEWKKQEVIRPGGLFLLGCSTSEIAGKQIGTSGSEEIAETIFEVLKDFQKDTGVELLFQCCEHLNRAIVLERQVQERLGLPEVNAVPQPSAGGAMATYAYHHMKDPVLVENVQADVGMDIGDTLIGMHLKPVVVPLRLNQTQLGDAHVTYAFTRPKLIGGERAIYKK